MNENIPVYLRNYHIITYGCQMNKNDSERIAGMLENIGYSEVEKWEDAHLVVLNTCSIRDRAERRVMGKLQILNYYRQKKNRFMELAITGCMPQHQKNWLKKNIPYLDYIVGVNNMEILPEYIHQKKNLDFQIKNLKPNRRKEEDVKSFEKKLNNQKRITGDKAWVSIMFGCDKFCTYCIVPFTRGREMSRKKENIFQEIESLQSKGIKKIVLLGQNVNSYGLTLYNQYDFSDLLEEIVKKYTWVEKIDFITSHPKDMNEKLIDIIAKYPNISREIHFPLQHGDNYILEKMNRGYTLEEYIDKVNYIRNKIKNAQIGTDLIVGFPGETDFHFQNLIDACDTVKFDYANTAFYSERPGTKSARMGNQVDEEVKNKRLNILNKRLRQIYEQKGVVRPILG